MAKSGDLDSKLIASVDATIRRAEELAGVWMACKPGCTECCIGPFPINALDARRLREGLEELRARDAVRAQAIVARAAAERAAYAGDFPGDPASGLLAADEARREEFFTRHEQLPCPVLDPATGLCELYAHRPLVCRTFGPPVRQDEQDEAPCRLWFTGAPAAEVERCRVEPDPNDFEGRVLEKLEKKHGESGETVIAFALGERRAGA